MDAETVFGPVAHGRQRDDTVVLELPESEFDIGLSPESGCHRGDEPIVVGRDEDSFADHLVFKVLLRCLVDVHRQSVVSRGATA